jgi:hypothetical protein
MSCVASVEHHRRTFEQEAVRESTLEKPVINKRLVVDERRDYCNYYSARLYL